jgi:hypothetical protein
MMVRLGKEAGRLAYADADADADHAHGTALNA